jgi:uncharacterized membrane protein|tara:strand:+ start:44 stop:790 length:747 start_codon:yes stop_codon:yes gene_type:complete
MNLSPLDIASFFWFIACWVGYSFFAKTAAKKENCLASVLYRYRLEWVKKLSTSGMSEVDAELLASLEKQVSFLASTSLLILASLVTVLSTASDVFLNINTLSFATEGSLELVQLKLLLLIFIFIYGFFTFTWSIRQYGFCFIVFGSSFNTVKHYKEAENYRVIAHNRDFGAIAKVLDRAAHSYNFGIRAYYFALAAMAWFISNYFFIVACAITVWVLYRREFLSSSLKALVSARLVDNVHDEEKVKFE